MFNNTNSLPEIKDAKTLYDSDFLLNFLLKHSTASDHNGNMTYLQNMSEEDSRHQALQEESIYAWFIKC